MKLVAPFLAYSLIGALCLLLVSLRRGESIPRRASVQIRAWKILCLLIVLLGMLRPYEVHSGITEILRTSAMTSGWYGERAAQQMNLLYVAAFLLAVLAAFILFETRHWHLSTRLGICGIFYLAGVATINILSLHGLDALLGRSLAGIPLRWMLDLIGLAMMAGAALWFRQASTRAARSPAVPD